MAEYYLRIQYIHPLGSGTTLGLSTSLNLRFHFFPQPMCHQQSQRSNGHDVFVWVFLKGHALIHSRGGEGHHFFPKKNKKPPAPPPPPPHNKKRTFPNEQRIREENRCSRLNLLAVSLPSLAFITLRAQPEQLCYAG